MAQTFMHKLMLVPSNDLFQLLPYLCFLPSFSFQFKTTPLHMACRANIETVKILLQAKADIHMKDTVCFLSFFSSFFSYFFCPTNRSGKQHYREPVIPINQKLFPYCYLRRQMSTFNAQMFFFLFFFFKFCLKWSLSFSYHFFILDGVYTTS